MSVIPLWCMCSSRNDHVIRYRSRNNETTIRPVSPVPKTRATIRSTVCISIGILKHIAIFFANGGVILSSVGMINVHRRPIRDIAAIIKMDGRRISSRCIVVVMEISHRWCVSCCSVIISCFVAEVRGENGGCRT